MFVHLGESTVISTDEIVVMMDMDKATTSKGNREFLKNAEAEKRIRDVSAPFIPKTYIVTRKGDIYLSPVLVHTLIRKIEK